MITGKILEKNGVPLLGRYAAGTLPTESIPCESDGARNNGFEWATPVTNNGLTVTSFKYAPVCNDSDEPPTEDSFKVVSLELFAGLGSYIRFVVPNDYTATELTALCCDGCGAIPDVDIPAPNIAAFVQCNPETEECPPCNYETNLALPVLGDDDTGYTLAIACEDEDGAAVTPDPVSVTAATAALLATAATTAWASEFGATFTRTDNNIAIVSTICKKLAVTLTVNSGS